MGVIRKYVFNSIEEVTEGRTEQEQLDISGSERLFTFPPLPEPICTADAEFSGVY